MPNDPKEGENSLGIWCDLLEKELKTALGACQDPKGKVAERKEILA
jgi:hypothetical protein